MGHSEGSPEREVHSNTCLPKKIETFQINNLTLHLKQLEELVALNKFLDQMNLTDIYIAFHPKEAKYTFFSNAHGTFSKIYFQRYTT